jgi:lipopolysaccharide/colanic/teichoic acid biosynthesis glycosyltransferase
VRNTGPPLVFAEREREREREREKTEKVRERIVVVVGVLRHTVPPRVSAVQKLVWHAFSLLLLLLLFPLLLLLLLLLPLLLLPLLPHANELEKWSGSA